MTPPAEADLRQTRPQPRGLARRLTLILVGLALLLAASCLVAIGLGDVHIAPLEVLRTLLARLQGASRSNDQVIYDIRLPRILLGAIVGAALSLGGAALQGLLLNPLADPYLIGVSAGAAFGATLSIRLKVAGLLAGAGKSLAGFIAALITLLIVYRLALRRGRIGRESFVLAGVVVGSFMWSLVTIIIATSPDTQLSGVISWLMGDLNLASSWLQVWLTGGLVAGAGLVLCTFGRDLNLLSLGEEPAKQLGVEVERLKKIIIVLAALLTAASVAVSGVIGFVGLIIPHIARRIWGPDHRILLPASALLGATFLVWADTLAHTIVASVALPVGIITSLLGAPFFCYLLVAQSRRSDEV